jgi:hypothetical protein
MRQPKFFNSIMFAFSTAFSGALLIDPGRSPVGWFWKHAPTLQRGAAVSRAIFAAKL